MQIKKLFHYPMFSLSISSILFFLLFLNLYSNAFGLIPNKWFSNWQQDSEAIVINSLENAKVHGLWYHYGLLGGYTKQIGLQGILLRIVNCIIRTNQIPFPMFRGMVVFLFCLSIFSLLYWCKKEFGLLSCIFLYIGVFFNRWILVSSRNLYWVTFTLLLPFLCMLFLCRREEKRGVPLKYFLLAAFVSVFLRVACGFEMVSTVMISMEVPFFYYGIKNSWGIKSFFKRFFVSAIGAISAFFTSLFINFIQQALYFHSVSSAVDNILYTVSKRTGMFDIAVDKIYQRSLEASKIQVLYPYFVEGEPIFARMHMASICLIFMLASTCCLIDKKYSNSIDKNRKKLGALSVAAWVSFMGPISWYILASPHSYIHRSINYILWSFPFLLLGCMLCGGILSHLCHDHSQSIKKWGKFVVPISAVIVMYFYVDFCKIGNLYLTRIREDGIKIAEAEYADIFYYDQNLYYVISSGYQKKKVFLHFYPTKSGQEYANEFGFVNEDFSFSKNELRTPFWSSVKIARVPLNKDYNIETIYTGQFDGSGREWETKFALEDFLEVPQEVMPDKLSDDHWTNGVFHDGTTLLFTSDDISLRLLLGKVLETSSGQRVLVTAVEKRGKWLHVSLNQPIDVSDGYPNPLKVIN